MPSAAQYAESSESVPPVGGVPWGSAGNASGAPDDFRASATLLSGQTSNDLRMDYDFSASVAADAEIVGFQVVITVRDPTFVNAETAKLQLYNDTTALGTNEAGGEEWAAADAEITYGGPTDLMGYAAPDPAVVRASTFGVRLTATTVDPSTSIAQVEAVELTVFTSSGDSSRIAAGDIEAGDIDAGTIEAGQVDVT